MSGTCIGTKRDGTSCTLPSNSQNGLCWAHDPKNAERRRRGQSRGGKAKASGEIRDLKKQLEDLVDDVLDGRIETGRAAVANQLINTRLRAVELERKVKEQDEVLVRIEQLEQNLQQQGGRGWGA